MRIAITGATGFIGKHLVLHFSKMKDFEIIVLAQTNEENPFIENSTVNFVQTDFSKGSLIGNLKDVDQLIHLAGVRMPRANDYVSLEFFFDGNIKLLENIAISAIESKVKRILFSSSIAVYGDFNKNEGIDENYELNPINNYGLSKLIGEKLLYQFSRLSNIETVSMRFSQIFGKGERPDLIMANFINKCKNNEDIIINANGFNERDYLYVEDAIRAIEFLVNSSRVNGCYNIGSNCSYSALNIAKIIKEKLKSKSSIIHSENPTRIIKQFMSTNKINSEIKWFPKWTLEDTINELQ